MSVENHIFQEIGLCLSRGEQPTIIFDFDQTIFDGDITFGTDRFPGMIEILLNNGYGNPNSFDFENKVSSKLIKKLYEVYDQFPEYMIIYDIGMFEGVSVETIEKLAESALDKYKYDKYCFPRAIKLIDSILKCGGHIIILTASPTLYVKPIISHFFGDGIQVVGVETLIKGGCITGIPTQVPFRQGKLDIVKNLLETKNIIAGFGNDDLNDRPWLTELAKYNKLSVFVDKEKWTQISH